MFTGILWRFDVWIEKRLLKRDGTDMLVSRVGDDLIFWPLSSAAIKVAADQLKGYVKKWGGYIVPESSWKQEYDKLHHGPCPRMVWYTKIRA